MVAVCAADGAAPASLANCVGGSVPNDNQTWGYVTAAGSKAPQGNAVVAKWGPGGSFSLSLTVPTDGFDAELLPPPIAPFTPVYVTGDERHCRVDSARLRGAPTSSSSSTATTDVLRR